MASTNSFIVQDASRKVHRDLKESLSNDIVSYLSEILTNADDSYRRLENLGLVPLETQKLITIEISKEKRKVGGNVFSITDNAEGMSEIELRQKFESYGADKARGEELYTRGLFGQGASDVLFNAAFDGKTAMIETIKDGEFTRAKFNWSSDKKIVEFESPVKSANRLETLRNSLGIEENGTRVSFGVPDRVKFVKKTIKEDIEKYPFFRFILTSPNRKVLLISNDQLIEEHLSAHSYLISDNESVTKEEFSFIFDGEKVYSELELFNAAKENFNQTILIIDQNNVIYDDHFFGYDTNPKAKSLVGYLKIKNFYKTIRSGLNAENPYALIRDNRKGIETSHEFYKFLKEKVSHVMNNALSKISDNEEVLDLSKNKKIAQVLKKLNSIFLERMPEEIPLSGKEKGIKPPENGLEFIRREMSLTVGKKYFVELFINSFLLDDKLPILLSIDKTVISLDQSKLKFNKSEANTFGLVRKSFLVTANEVDEIPTIIKAVSGNFEAIAEIITLEEEVFYPRFGFQFKPDHLKHIESSSHKTYLYLDKTILDSSKEIVFETNDSNLNLSKRTLKVDESSFNKYGIAIFSLSIHGDKIPKKSKIIAKYGENNTSVILEIIEKKPRDPLGMLGLISSIKFRPDKDDLSYQAKFSLSDRTLYINQSNPINKTMIRNLSSITEITNKLGDYQIKYILDIVSYHSAIQILEYQSKHGQVVYDPTNIYNWEKAVYNQKTEIYEALKDSIKGNEE
jgi:hypothetical protein